MILELISKDHSYLKANITNVPCNISNEKINFSVENVDIGETIFSYYLNVLL